MGCGHNSQQNVKPSQLNQSNAQSKQTKTQAQTAQATKKEGGEEDVGMQFEDKNKEFDEDIQLEILGKRIDPSGKEKSNYERNQKRPEDNQQTFSMFEETAAEAGEQAMASKPFIGALIPPSKPPNINTEKPSINLALDYAYGYRCFDTRNNLVYTNNPENIAYMTAALGVVLNKTSNTQKFFGAGSKETAKGHNDDIVSLAIHPNRELIATGEVGKNPTICI